MVDTDDTRRTTDEDDERRTTPRVWHKLPTGELIKVVQQRSRRTRLIIITARRFLASKNQFQLANSGVWLSRPPNSKF